jgi:hypothetical protein
LLLRIVTFLKRGRKASNVIVRYIPEGFKNEKQSVSSPEIKHTNSGIILYYYTFHEKYKTIAQFFFHKIHARVIA